VNENKKERFQFALPDSSHEALGRNPTQTSKSSGDGGGDNMSEALKKKIRWQRTEALVGEGERRGACWERHYE